MPIREDRQALSPLIYRTLKFGDLADLVMLDTRLVGRDLQAASRDDVASIESPARSLLGRGAGRAGCAASWRSRSATARAGS